MLELIATIILICSLLGMGVIIFRKIPVLVNLSEVLPEKGEPFSSKLKKKIKEFNPLKNFSYEVFLQKLIFRIRILTLKTDNQTFNWLQKLRERIKKKKLENDNYWEELKKATKNNN
ncbi:MAG: hypothetical protein QME57_04410 [Patescibacteria group bacterium]|nr:hypothetical protein [Patescibacteria group bacterium]